MSDLGISHDGGPAPEGGQAPETGGQPTTDWERQYNELRPEFTRATQERAEAQQRLSEYEAFMEALSDPETQAQALASLGFEMDTGANRDEDEFADPLEREVEYLRGVVDELRQGRELEAASREEQEILDLRDNFIGESISQLEQAAKMEFDDEEEEVLGNLAIAMSNADGLPDVQGAFEALYGERGILERRRSQWIDSKTAAYAAPWGTSIPSDKKPQTRAERIDFVDQRLRHMDQLQ